MKFKKYTLKNFFYIKLSKCQNYKYKYLANIIYKYKNKKYDK